MGKKGGSKHLKRLPTPTFWPIHKKKFKWVVKPKPGPHKKDRSFPILVILREMLGLVKNRKEAHRLLSERHVKVDGVIRRKDNYPVGLMDVLEIPVVKKVFRLLPKPHQGLSLHVINEDEKELKLCKIINKSTVRGGNLQLNLHDGRNILIKITDTMNTLEDVYKTHDVLKIEIPSSQILDHLPFNVGTLAIVENGKNVGRWGKVVSIERRATLHPSIVTLQDLDGSEFRTILEYVFPIGKEEPWISMPKEVKS